MSNKLIFPLFNEGNRLNNMVIKVSLNDIFSSDKLEICNTFSNVNNGEKLNFICKNQFKEYQFASIAEHPQPHFYVCEVEVHERGTLVSER